MYIVDVIDLAILRTKLSPFLVCRLIEIFIIDSKLVLKELAGGDELPSRLGGIEVGQDSKLVKDDHVLSRVLILKTLGFSELGKAVGEGSLVTLALSFSEISVTGLVEIPVQKM